MKKIIFILLCFMLFTSSAQSQFFKKKAKKEVPGQTVTLTRHPDEVFLKGANSEDTWYFFYDVKKQCFFITEKKGLYDEISKFLPAVIIPGRTVELEGTSINPWTKFSKEQLDKQSKNAGFAINKYNVFRIFSYSLIDSSLVKPEPEKATVKSDTVKVQPPSPVKKKRPLDGD